MFAIKSFVTAFFIIILLDAIWLTTMRSFYAKGLSEFLRTNFLILPGIMVWILLALAIVVFVLPQSSTLGRAALLGALLGLVTYGVYDLTNLAVLNQWPLSITIVDIMWGSFLCSVGSIVAFLAA